MLLGKSIAIRDIVKVSKGLDSYFFEVKGLLRNALVVSNGWDTYTVPRSNVELICRASDRQDLQPTQEQLSLESYKVGDLVHVTKGKKASYFEVKGFTEDGEPLTKLTLENGYIETYCSLDKLRLICSVSDRLDTPKQNQISV